MWLLRFLFLLRAENGEDKNEDEDEDEDEEMETIVVTERALATRKRQRSYFLHTKVIKTTSPGRGKASVMYSLISYMLAHADYNPPGTYEARALPQ